MGTIGRFIRTVIRLRPRQVWTRVVRRLRRPGPDLSPAPARRAPVAALRPPVQRKEGWLSPTRVRLLNVEREFDAGIDWRPADATRLWVYTLSYFSDLPQTAAARVRVPAEAVGAAAVPAGRLTAGQTCRLVDSWIAANPPGTPDTWDPYPISLRAVSWIKWILLLEAEDVDAAAPDTVESAVQSLAVQLRFLERRIEFDISANHLMANAVALAAGGLFFGGREGDRWARVGFDLLFRELAAQVHHDGGHYERSPMYHALVLEQLLDVLNLWSRFPGAVPIEWRDHRERFERRVLTMLDWLSAMAHPDGAVSFFNDSTLGPAPAFPDLVDYARRLGLTPGSPIFAGITRLDDSQFFRLRSDDGRTVLLFDAGGPEPGHQPGHSHSESLSFELSRDGRRVFVNSGVSTYEPGPQRSWERGTAAHNTVGVEGEEQSEVWASHRCGRRARILRSGVRDTCVYAEHGGYRRLPGRPTHLRELCVTDTSVEIIDKIVGEREHLLEWFFHLHPDVTANPRDKGVELTRDGRPLATLLFPFGAVASVSTDSWHPGFNRSIPGVLIHFALRASLPFEFQTTVSWVRDAP